MKKAKKGRAQTRKAVASVSTPKIEKMAKTSSLQVTPFNSLVVMFIAFFVAHSVIIYIANMLFPEAVVLGTNIIPSIMALFYSMVVFTFITVGVMPVIEMLQKAREAAYSNTEWMMFYFVINFISLWLVARFAEQLGLGLASWMVVAALALIMDVVQGVIAMSLMKQAK